MNRRRLLQGMLAGSVSIAHGAWAAAPVVQVYKSASCGCCDLWVRHLEKNGFVVRATDVADPSAYRRKFGVPEALGACHTGWVDGYALEGHVPAADIKRLLRERPKATGLAVPSMPVGSPGMEGPRNDPYDVFLFHPGGKYTVYRHYSS